MAKDSAKVEEYCWAKKVHDACSLTFDEQDGDPTPDDIAEQKLKTNDASETNSYLDEAVLGTLGNFIAQAWFPLDHQYAQALREHKTTIQSYYKSIVDITDRAAKRDIEAHYQPAINLIADTEILIDSKGQSAEEQYCRAENPNRPAKKKPFQSSG